MHSRSVLLAGRRFLTGAFAPLGLIASLAVGCGDSTERSGADAAVGAGAAHDAGTGGNAGKAGVTGAGGLPGPCSAADGERVLESYSGAPIDVAVDATSVYWSSFDVDPAENFTCTVRKAACDGGSSEVLASVAGLGRGSIAIDAASVYWALGRSVKKVALEGGAPTTLTEDQSDAGSIVVDSTSAYWLDETAGNVMKIGLDGGTPTTLASGQDKPYGIAIDAVSVYWTNATSVMKVALDGGAPTTLASAQGRLTSIALDATSVYFTNRSEGTVMKVALDGGSLTTLASEQGAPCAIAVDSTNVYWATLCEAVPRVLARLVKVPLAGGTPSEVKSFSPRTGVLDFTLRGPNIYAAWSPSVYTGSVGRVPLE